MIKYLGYALAGVGFFLVLGTAGSDCDGKCMENAMSLWETVVYSTIGLVMIAVGLIPALNSEE
jgi:hypothetical protein